MSSRAVSRTGQEVVDQRRAARENPRQKYHFPTMVDALVVSINGLPPDGMFSFPLSELPDNLLDQFGRLILEKAGKNSDPTPPSVPGA